MSNTLNLLFTSEKYLPYRNFWEQKLAEAEEDFILQSGNTDTGKGILEIQLSAEHTKQISDMVKNNDFGIYIVHLALFNFIFREYTSAETVCIKTPLFGAEKIGTAYVNEVPLIISFTELKTLKELIVAVQKTASETYKYQNYPLSFAGVENTRKLSNTGISMNVLHVGFREFEQKGLQIEILKSANGLGLIFRFDKIQFSEKYIQQLAQHFQHTVNYLSKTEIPLSEIDILSEEEKNLLLIEYNNQQITYDEEVLLHEVFEKQVQKTPDALALAFENEQVTYKELNHLANKLAHELRKNGIGKESVVALLVQRSIKSVTAMIATLKAGATYLPIDPNYPADRVIYMLEDSKAALLITDDKLPDSLLFSGKIIDVSKEHFETNSTENPERINSKEDLAYIIYTSGSTGKPKGVAIRHRNANSFLQWCKTEFENTKFDVMFAPTSYSFDLSIFETFYTLQEGKKIRLLKSGLDIATYLQSEKNILINTVPSVINELLNQENDLKNVVGINMAGEPIPFSVKNKLDFTKIEVRNLYGPSEDTTYSTCYKFTEKDSIQNIGKPLANTQAYILNQFKKLVPPGMPGELYLAGDGVAKGYLHKPELSAERFLQNPFKENSIFYKTGDLVRWLPDGNIEYLGRIDNQVKIRGFRIELGEIENKLLLHPAISEAVVIDKTDDNGAKYLCAYFVAKETLTIETLREHLAQDLPDYMIPAYFVALEKIPLTPNGKTDKKALPNPQKAGIASAVEYIAPTTETEILLAGIWKELLKTDKIGTLDNFFVLGGNSLKSTMLVSRIHRATGKEIALRDFFAKPTIKGLTELIEKTEVSEFVEIKPLPKQDYYELSPAQNRLWLLDKIQEGTADYNMLESHIFEQKINPVLVEKSFNELLKRHESLRTVFAEINGEPKQKILSEANFTLAVIDISAEKNQQEKVEAIYRNENNFVFDLSKDLLLRATLIKLNEEKWQLIFVMHHIVTDGWSMEVLKRELLVFYAALAKGQKPEIAPLAIQYKEYAAWQNQLLKSKNAGKQKEFWHNNLSGELPLMELPTDGLRSNQLQNTGSSYVFFVENDTLKKLHSVAEKTNASLFMVLLSGFSLLLNRLTDSPDVLIGTPVAGRGNEKLNDLIGFFLNTVILRNKIDAQRTLTELVEQVRDNTIQALEYQNYPFEQLVDELNIPRDVNKFPITSVFLNLINYDENSGKKVLTDFSPKHVTDGHKAKFDINLYVVEYENGLMLKCDYKNELYSAPSIAVYMQKLQQLLYQIAEHSEQKIIDTLTNTLPAQQETLKDASWYEQGVSINHIIKKQFKKYANRIAIKNGKVQITYSELDSFSSKVAKYIAENRGTKKHIAVCVEHNQNMPLTVISVLKSGNIYVPLDPDYPLDRLKFITADTQPELILTDKANSQLVKNIGNFSTDNILLIDDLPTIINEPETDYNDTKVSGEDIAYILYTSGSTGNPKGTIQTHKAVLHFISNYSSALSFTEMDVLTGFSSICFDSFVNDMYGALLNGAAYVPMSIKKEIGIAELEQKIKDEKISVWHSVPTVFRQLSLNLISEKKQLTGVRIIKMTGEPSTRDDFEKFKKVADSQAKFVVSYGATESTLTAINLLSKNDNISTGIVPVGKLVNRTEIKLLNTYTNAVDTCETGELLLNSDFVTPGYWNNEEFNQKAFVTIENKRFYKTGDLGRIRPNGTLEIIGRKDNQVKVRGIRIELSEIENNLLLNKAIKQAVVLVKDDVLVAYIISAEKLSVTQLRNGLASKLPAYMIPSTFIRLEKFPFTPSGKIDKRALLTTQGEELSIGTNYVAASTETEKYIAELWKTILKKEKIGINDNFFELGGHSMSATIFVARLQAEKQVKLSLKQLFLTPSIGGIAVYLQNSTATEYPAIVPAPAQEYYPLSAAQNRLYILSKLGENNTVYNLPGAAVISGNIDTSQVQKAFEKLIARHETLRTTFHTINGKPVQKIAKKIAFEIQYLQQNGKENYQLLQEFVRPFDLEKAPLLRVGLCKLSTDTHLLLFDMHHIISDGFSLKVLGKEFMALYQNVQLPELSIQYKDFAVWQSTLAEKGLLNVQEKYWLDTFSDEIPVLNLPLDYARPKLQNYAGAEYKFSLKALYPELQKLALAHNVSVNMLMQAAYFVLLAQYSGQEDIVTGTTISGRQHANLEHLIGMFVNTLAIRNKPEFQKSFRTFLHEVKQQQLEAFENQDYQFEDLVEKLNISRQLNRNPLFDVMYNYQKSETENTADSAVKITPLAYENTVAKFDISLNIYDTDNSIESTIKYATGLFKAETIEKFAAHYTNLLSTICKKPESKIGDLTIISEKEYTQVTQQFNDTYLALPADVTYIDLFEKQVNETPENIALVNENVSLSYKVLNERANQLSAYLQKKYSVKANDKIALLLERNEWMPIALLAVFKCGAAYVPIDPEYPAERIQFMQTDCGAIALLDAKELDTFRKEQEQYAVTNVARKNTPSGLAYIIYTSGSTGKPKGVMVTQANMLNYLKGFQAKHHIDTDFLFTSSYCFDASLKQVFLPLLTGKKVHVYNLLKDLTKLPQYMATHGLSILNTTPGVLNELMLLQSSEQLFKQLKTLVVGGEVFESALFYKLKKANPDIQIINAYGPTETCANSITLEYKGNEFVNSIGTPMPNTQLYIVNKNGQLVPPGIAGELWIGGNGVAEGYLNREELTQEKFTENTFNGKGKLYKTGDLCKWLPEGNIVYLGRMDQQVKIRGHRIELGEIENCIAQYAGVSGNIVLDKTDNIGNKFLCAYIVGNNIVLQKLREHIATHLPDYMVPAYFVVVEKIPLTGNGKVDKKALPEPNGQTLSQTEYVAAANATEEILVTIWQEILSVTKPGTNDDFFMSGGNSMKAVRMAALVHEKFGKEIPLRLLFELPTIKHLADYLISVENLQIGNLEEIVSLLNKKTDKNIFAFPPLAGHSYSYKTFAESISTHSVYGFNFVEADNRIEQYIEKIKELQPKGPYLFFGYSIGGNLAYLVSKKLSDNGERADIILLDTPKRTPELKLSAEQIKEGIEQFLGVNNTGENNWYNSQFIQDKIKRKVTAYLEYMNEQHSDDKTSGNIHIIVSEKQTPEKEANKKLWANLTKATFTMYSGYGIHEDMMKGDNLERNAEIVREIVS